MHHQNEINANRADEEEGSAELPPVVHAIIQKHWQRLENDLAKEELINNLDCFCRLMQRMPVELLERELKKPEYADVVTMREFLKFFGFGGAFPVGDEARRYRYRLLQEFFNLAWAKLSAREQKFVAFFARTRRSLAVIARAMNLSSVAAVQKFQHRCFQVVTRAFFTLLIAEAQRPGLEPRRREVVQEWVAHFRKRQAPAAR